MNGLVSPHIDDVAFPADGSFVLSWYVGLPTGPVDAIGAFVESPVACEVQMIDEWSNFPPASGEARTSAQSHRLIRPSSKPELVWSSGDLPCATGVLVLPSDVTSLLAPDATYLWRVRVASAPWSNTARFNVAPSTPMWSKAEWIGGGSQLRTDWQLPRAEQIVRARAHVSGVGAFALHINGAKVGTRIMDPGQAVYDQRVLFVSFNVTSALRSDRVNTVGAMLGNGKWGYLDIYVNRTAIGDQSGDGSRAFICLLVATLSDGTEVTLTSRSSTWQFRHGPIVYDHMWHGEIYDIRKELVGGSLPWDAAPLDAYPPGAWTQAVKMTPKVGALAPQIMEGIRVTRTLAAVKIVRQGRARLLIDFGQNMAGYTSLKIRLDKVQLRGESPKTIMMRVKHTEITDTNGSAYNNFYPGMEFGHASKTCSMNDWYARKWFECANQTNAVIFQIQTNLPVQLSYTPTFTYHGFRFAEVTAVELLPDGSEVPLDDQIAEMFPFGASLMAHEAHTDVQQVLDVNFGQPARRNSSSQLWSQIFNATMMSHVSQLWSIPTDCPQREKRGWMGDAGISANSLQTFYDVFAFHSNFLQLIMDNQRKGCGTQPRTTIYGPCSDPVGMNGSVPDVTPFSTGPYGGNPGTTDWQATFVTLARDVMKHYGPRAVPLLKKMWEPLESFMGYLERLVDSDTGLLLVGARGDWIPPAEQPFTTPVNSTAAFFHTLCISYMAEIATFIGRKDDATRYVNRFEANRKAYHMTFFNNKVARGDSTSRCCYDSGSQASNMYALLLGVVPSEFLNATVGMLIASFYNRSATTWSPHVRNRDPIEGLPAWGSGPHLDVGIFGTTWMFDVLHRYGYDSVALDILSQRSYPSFGYFIANDATTLWETWDGDKHHIGLGTSRNHIMYGGGVNRFLATAIGAPTIDTAPLSDASNAGWSRFMVRPSPHAIRSLSCASAHRNLPSGPSTVSWCLRTATSQLELNVTVPLHTVASVHFPLLGQGGAMLGQCVMMCQHGVMTVVSSNAVCSTSGAVRSATCNTRQDGEDVLVVELPAGHFSMKSQIVDQLLAV